MQLLKLRQIICRAGAGAKFEISRGRVGRAQRPQCGLFQHWTGICGSPSRNHTRPGFDKERVLQQKLGLRVVVVRKVVPTNYFPERSVNQQLVEYEIT